MVAQDRRRDLANMYKLLKPIDKALVVLIKEIQEHITRIGLDAINSISSSGDKDVSQMFVEIVLDVHRKYVDLIREVFNSDQQFLGALDKACATIVHHRKNPKIACRSPELLARYCDSLLKRGLKGVSESEVDDKLSLSITVFKYIDDKDVFQKFYAKMFAKRLIHSQSISMDSEEAMINKLKNACGYEFTSKLHRMFTDIKLSDDLSDSFTSWQREEKLDGTGLSFSMLVLQAGAWPLGQAAISPFALPQPLEKPVSYFETFYSKKFNGRKLTWLHHLSTAEVKMAFPDKNSVTPLTSRKVYSVSMGTYHMGILYMFESTDSLTFKELQDHTKLSDEQLMKHLQSLIDTRLIVVPELMLSLSEASSSSSLTPRSLAQGFDLSPVASPINSSPCPPSPSPSFPGGSKEEPKPVIVLTNPSPNTIFQLNTDFSNKRIKFKITAVAQKEVQQVISIVFISILLTHSFPLCQLLQQTEVEQTHASVDEDRKLYLQAAIVRIMKARKLIKHTNLMEEVISQAKNRFTPSVPMIKKCIEALIEKGYLERTQTSSEEYSYIA